MKLSIIIPAYNEEKTIEKLIHLVKKADVGTAVPYMIMFVLMYVFISKKLIKVSIFKNLTIPLMASL